MATASDYITGQTMDARGWSTAEWDMVDAQIRERAFFMAGVKNAQILQGFQDAAREIAAGGMTTNEARRKLRQLLKDAGYNPEPGTEGGIKDLSSRRRMEVTLRTNVDMARGWMQREQMKRDITMPGLELYRAKAAKAPRDWAERWQEAAEAVNWDGVARGGEMVALIESPIWVKLSRFDLPYPPFDFNSSMRVRSVHYDRCIELGLIEGEPEGDEPLPRETPAEDEAGQQGDMPKIGSELMDEALGAGISHNKRKKQQSERNSFNEDWEASLDRMSKAVVSAIEEELGPFASCRGDKLLCTDLNGTRKYTPQELAEIWKKEIPKKYRDAGHRNFQQEALEEWIFDSKHFDDNGKATPTAKLAMQNLLQRLESRESDEVLYRGMAWDRIEKMDELREICKKQGFYSPASWKMADSFGTARTAEKFAAGNNQKRQQTTKFQAILKVVKHHSGKDLRPLYDSITSIQQNHGKPMKLEGEVLFAKGCRFRIVSIQRTETRTKDGKIIRDTYTLEEI